MATQGTPEAGTAPTSEPIDSGEALVVTMRPPTPSDLKYIRDTWLSSYRTSPYAGVVPNNLYDNVYSETIDQLILRGMRFVVVANPANPALMLGWLAYEVDCATSQDLTRSSPRRDQYVVHFIFVKPTYRRLGVASQALASVGISGASFFYTFKTSSSKYLKGGIYRPEIARRKNFGEGSLPSKPTVH